MIPVSESDVKDGTIAVGMRVQVQPNEDCFRDDNSTAQLRDALVTYELPTEPPETLASFLSPGVDSFSVVLPADPTPAEMQAGLDAVLGLRHSQAAATAIGLTVGNQLTGSFTDRVVEIAETPEGEPNGLTVSDYTLLVTGSGDALSAAAVSLGDPNTVLLNLPQVTDLPGTIDYQPITRTAPLSALGYSPISLTGIGTNAVALGMAQAAFGAPVERIKLDLRGALTPLSPGQQGRVDFLWNGVLKDSVNLTETQSSLVVGLDLPPEDLLGSNTLTVQLTFLPAGGNCSNPGVPGRVDIDVETSTVTPVFGDSQPPGLQRFPQAFEQVVPVTLGTASPQAGPAVEQAAQVLAATAAASPLQYQTRLGDERPDQRARLVAGATQQEAADLGAPVLGNRGNDSVDFPAGSDEPYASLEGFAGGGKDVLLIGASEESAVPLALDLAAWAVAENWPSLTEQAYVLGERSSIPEAFSLPRDEADPVRMQLIAAAIITAVLLVALLAWLWWRPKRRRRELGPAPGTAG